MKVIIIGNGVAGVSAAEAIRSKRRDVNIIMYSDEKYYHYSRPRVIEYLSGKVLAERIIIKNKEFYEENNIKINLSTKVKNINTANKTILLENGNYDTYDKLIIAAGASSFLPPVKGIDLPGVFTLRTIDDADKIMNYSKDKKIAVVIGGGLLGLEAAMSLENLGLSVYVVEFFERLLPRQLDKDAAEIFKKIMEEKGLKILLNKQTDFINKNGENLIVQFKDGETLNTDIVLFSAGIKSNFKITEGTDIKVNKGIVINSNMETTVKDIFAAGDVAEFSGIVYGIWPIAKEQGMLTGLATIGEKVEYKGSIISTKLKVAGVELASLGDIEVKEGLNVVAKSEQGVFKKLFFQGKLLKGAILLGDTKDYQRLQEITKNQQEIDNPDSLL